MVSDGLQCSQERNDGFNRDFSRICTLASIRKGQSRKEKPYGDPGLVRNPKPSAAQPCSYPSVLHGKPKVSLHLFSYIFPLLATCYPEMLCLEMLLLMRMRLDSPLSP